MAALNMTIQHGQTPEAARANFEKGVTPAREKYGSYVRQVEWSDDHTSAHLTGSGFDVVLSVDDTAVHATGTIPFFAKMLEAPVRKFIEDTFRSNG